MLEKLMLPAPAPKTPPIMLGAKSSKSVQQHAPPQAVANGANSVEGGDCKACRAGIAGGDVVVPMESGDAAGGAIAGDAAGAGGGTFGSPFVSSICAMIRVRPCSVSSANALDAVVTAPIKRRQPMVVTPIAEKCPLGRGMHSVPTFDRKADPPQVRWSYNRIFR
jgi:hypothetical protein